MDEINAYRYGSSVGVRSAAPATAEDDITGRAESEPSQAALDSVVWAPPVFVVGCPRSGTTLAQTMLDSHPSLNVLYEANFLVDIPLGLHSSFLNASEALAAAEAHPNFQPDKFDVRGARSVCRELGIADSAGAMRVLAASRAVAEGKRRWGNKTPKAVLHLPELAILFPDAQFVHMIRDGRDSAASQARIDRTLIQGALLWRTGMRSGRRAGTNLGPDRYLEVRLEDLLSSPEQQIRKMCAFLGEEFDQSLLNFHTTARERIPTSGLSIHPRLGEPPRPLPTRADGGAKGVAERAAAALMESELVELGYLPARPPRRRRRIFYEIIGYTLFLVSLRKGLRDLLRHLSRAIGARRIARAVSQTPSARPVPKNTVSSRAVTPASADGPGEA